MALKLLDAARSQLQRLLGPHYAGRKLLAGAALALVLFFYFAIGDYRITAPVRLEGLIQRSISAPFEGYVLSEHKRAGDEVRKGDVLATLDDNDLALEHLRWITQRRQHLREYDRALAERNRAELSIIQAQIDQATAQVELFGEQLARANLTAPFAGIIVSGDLSQSVGASVERGEQLFTIAPLDSYRVILDVDERDIAEVEPGQIGDLVLSSTPDAELHFIIIRVTPVAEAKDGRNAFRVEARLNEVTRRLRPGMEGIGKIEIDRRRLLWIWTHRLIDWVRLSVWSWWP